MFRVVSYGFQNEIFEHSLNIPRKNFMAVEHGNSIYVFGGKGEDDEIVFEIEKLFYKGNTSVSDIEQLSESFKLNNNYPNPFNSSTVISFQLDEMSFVKINITSSVGTNVKTLFSGHCNNGLNRFEWDGKNTFGRDVSSGVYFYRIIINNKSITNKMLLLR